MRGNFCFMSIWPPTNYFICFPLKMVLFYCATASQPKKTLFIKNLLAHTTEDDIKSLNSDILKVRMDMSQNNSNTK